MNKKLIVPIAAAIVLISGYVVLFAMGGDKTPSNNNASSDNKSEHSYTAVNACDLFTLEEAKELMGPATTAGSNTGPASSKDVNVDTCTYVNNATTVADIKTATVLVRSALTDEGDKDNKDAFKAGGAAYPSGAQAVAGYGDKAYWDPATYQLAIHEHHSWISVAYGGTNPTKNTLDDAKLVANKVLNTKL